MKSSSKPLWLSTSTSLLPSSSSSTHSHQDQPSQPIININTRPVRRRRNLINRSTSSSISSNLSESDQYTPDSIPLSTITTTQSTQLYHHQTLILPHHSHRHSTYLNQILSLHHQEQQQQQQPIKKTLPINLESDGWTYIGTRDDVRLYTRELSSTEQDIISQHQDEFNLNPTNSLPYFRGEGYLNGQWDSFDLAATLSSIPVRSICDSKLNLSKSSLIQILNSNQSADQLIKLSFNHPFPIGSRHQSLLQAFRPFQQSRSSIKSSSSSDLSHPLDPGGIWVSTSVRDSLIPESNSNSHSWLSLCGFSFRPTQLPPIYSSSLPSVHHHSQSQISISPKSNSSQSRSHDRTSPIQALSYHSNQIKSNQSIPSPPQHSGDLPSIVKRLSLTISPVQNKLGSLPAPVLSRSVPSHQTTCSNRRLSKTYQSISPSSSLILRRRRASSILSTASPAHYASISPTQKNKSGSSAKTTKTEANEKERVGTHVSVVMKVDHGEKVPLSLVHQVLCADVPNLINNLNRYLNRYGFVPHLSRRNEPKGIKIISEEFNPINRYYKLQFISQFAHEVLIRFHGLTFTSSTRSDDDPYEIIVLRSKKWKVEFDQIDRGSFLSSFSSLSLEEEEEEDKENQKGWMNEDWKGSGTIKILSSIGLPIEVLIRKRS
ncbi:hypothetical protein DFH28DRAFT_1127372 [Melampsora americana]|nr:hypothetical protein DFH28DRAFT_1127372 [Melampsora americana]